MIYSAIKAGIMEIRGIFLAINKKPSLGRSLLGQK